MNLVDALRRTFTVTPAAGSGRPHRPAPQPAARPTLSGTVTDDDGEPLKGLYVKVSHRGTMVAWAETDHAGHYEIGLPAGVYEVRFSSRAYHELVDPDVPVTGPTTIDATLVPVI